MSRRNEEIAAWIVGLLAVGAMLLFPGCGNRWSPTEAVSENELFVVAETARFSGIAGQRVRGEISPRTFDVNCLDGTPCHAFGWYEGTYGKGAKGVAYYYQRDVNRADRSSLSSAAAHEVCHSVTGPTHDQRLWDCMKGLGK